jgi:hypothetical protein
MVASQRKQNMRERLEKQRVMGAIISVVFGLVVAVGMFKEGIANAGLYGAAMAILCAVLWCAVDLALIHSAEKVKTK